jgi:glycosyl transferase family 25
MSRKIVIDWSFIDQFVFINLDKRIDRKEKIEQELREIGVPQDRLHRFSAIEASPGYLGCSKSHLAVLKMAKKNGWKNCCIFEDDIAFMKDRLSFIKINSFLRFLAVNPWDVGLLSFNAFEVSTVSGYASVYRARKGFTTGSYIVNSSYYDRLISNFEEGIAGLEKTNLKNLYTLDTHWQNLMNIDNWYWSYPNFGYQAEDYSDIEGMKVNYRHLFYKKIGGDGEKFATVRVVP